MMDEQEFRRLLLDKTHEFQSVRICPHCRDIWRSQFAPIAQNGVEPCPTCRNQQNLAA